MPKNVKNCQAKSSNREVDSNSEGKSRTRRNRGYAFTLNNYTGLQVDTLRRSMDSKEGESSLSDAGCTYLIFGKEVGKKGTPHLQGFVYFPAKKKFKAVKELLPSGAHIEAAKAGVVENIMYCMKDGAYEEFGKRPRQGKRSDLDLIYHDIENGKSSHDIARDNFSQWCYHRKSFDEYRKMLADYATELVIYNPANADSMYNAGLASSKQDVIVMDGYNPPQVWLNYFSGRYRAIVVPRSDWLDVDIFNYEIAGYHIRVVKHL